MNKLISGAFLTAVLLLLVSAVSPEFSQFGYNAGQYQNIGLGNNLSTFWITTNATPSESRPNGSFATVTDGRIYVRTNGAWVQIFSGVSSGGGGSGIATLNGKGTNTTFYFNDVQVFDPAGGYWKSPGDLNLSVDSGNRTLFDVSGSTPAITWNDRVLHTASGASAINWNADDYFVCNLGFAINTFNNGVETFINLDEFGRVTETLNIDINKKLSNVDGKTTGASDIFTVPSGKHFILTSAQIYVTDSTGLAVAGQVKITASVSGDMTAQTTLTGTTSGKVANISPLTLTGVAAGDTDTIQVNVVVGATATTLTFTVIVCGYYL